LGRADLGRAGLGRAGLGRAGLGRAGFVFGLETPLRELVLAMMSAIVIVR
jgi:hypothetical protein